VKILILGRYKAERLLAPFLAAGATDVVLWADSDPGIDTHGASFQYVPMDRQAAPEDIVELLAEVKPDIAVPNVSGEGEEQLILAYALAAEQAGADNPLRWHPSRFAEPSVDKVSFHRVARSLGLPIPDGDIAPAPEDVRRVAGRLGGPVILKEARTQAREGVHAALTPRSLEAILSRGTLRFPLVVQRMVAGEEIGVEILSTSTGSCRFPPVSTGDMDSRCDPAARVRSAPGLLSRPALATVNQIIDTLEERLRPCGPWQLDLALSGDDVSVLEINGRLGGLADLGLGATGFDSHRLFGELVLGRRLPRPAPVAVAMEIPVVPGLMSAPSSGSVHVSVLNGSPTHPFPVDWDYERFSLRSADRAGVERWISQLDPATIRVPVSALRAQADRAFDGLQAATSAGAQRP
jgi:hypothetical protein